MAVWKCMEPRSLNISGPKMDHDQASLACQVLQLGFNDSKKMATLNKVEWKVDWLIWLCPKNEAHPTYPPLIPDLSRFFSPFQLLGS